ncbi:hypothetical protein JB92DRAFT_3307239, partial [Gautieria morchelliformis]
IKRKELLQTACRQLALSFKKTWNLLQLRQCLVNHWCVQCYLQVCSVFHTLCRYPDSVPAATLLTIIIPPKSHSSSIPTVNEPPVEETLSASLGQKEACETEEALLSEFGVEGAAVEELLGYDEDGLDEEEEEEEEVNLQDDIISTPCAWARSDYRPEQMFCEQAHSDGKIQDCIVGEHSLLLFIDWCATRPKRNRKGEELPGTFIGASQIKKMFFGVLRICKVQHARDPTLATKRPATTVIVYDAVKNRMDEALERARRGLIPGEDAPDIVANTFLENVTDDQFHGIGLAFLQHRELRMVINGHLAWTCQNGTGNHGDDLRALKLCELQPFTWLHPNNETAVPCILGLQSEEKAGQRGMKTTVNPSYSTWITHRDPLQCPLGAMVFYHHYLHDVYQLSTKLDIDWSVNKNWRNVRVLVSSSPTAPYNESNLYNLYCQAYKKANFVSNIKVHLPRHLLGYLQEKMAYTYDPIWQHVRVPESFLRRVCPIAEEVLKSIHGKQNLSGACNYWDMIVTLRPYLFQCATAVYQVNPTSALFRLPALQGEEVVKWMCETFPRDLATLKANAASPIDLARIQNEALQMSLEEIRAELAKSNAQLTSFGTLLACRTAVLSPAKGYSNEGYARSGRSTSTPCKKLKPNHRNEDPFLETPLPLPQQISGQTAWTECEDKDESSVYPAVDGTLRAFVLPSPSRPDEPRMRTQIDLVLPPATAFHASGATNTLWPPILGQQSVRWADVFSLIRQPGLLWDVWKPSKTLDQVQTVDELWQCWSAGESALDNAGNVTGSKPPLRLVEQYFKSTWRKGATVNTLSYHPSIALIHHPISPGSQNVGTLSQDP